MKNFQSIIQKYITNHQKHKKYLAAVFALSVLVSFGVSAGLIMPAVSWSGDDVVLYNDNIRMLAGEVQMLNNYAGEEGNNGYSPRELSAVELLVGSGSFLAQGATSANDVISNAKGTYFLGIASEFCIFLENDFKPTAADAEGRVAVGGNVIFNSANKNESNYQIGAGDFKDSIALKDTDNYVGVSGFAHLIMGGDEIHRVNPNGMTEEGSKLADEDKDRYKRFVVNEDTIDFNKSKHKYIVSASSGEQLVNYENGGHNHFTSSWTDTFVAHDELSQFYMSAQSEPLIDFTDAFSYIREQSNKLKDIKQTKDATASWAGSVLTCTLPEDCKDKTVYFVLDEWRDPTEINFDHIPTYIDDNGNPQLANIIVTCGGTRIDIGNDNNHIVNTKINGTSITVNQLGNDGKNNKNNHKYSENILYNFYEAEKLRIDANFNGTLLAPNANATSYDPDKEDEIGDEDNRLKCHGHLSGALIAKSFRGGEEFGYRPYRGTVDILGSQSGYVVPFDKFITGTINYLKGASFAVTETVDGKENTVASWTSGENTQYTAIPTGVDFTGEKEDYSNTSVSNIIEHTYTVKETKAPAGYHKTDKTYTVKVTETVNRNYFKTATKQDGTILHIPQVVDVTVEIISSDSSEAKTTFSFQTRDIYDTDGDKPVQRQVIIYNADKAVKEVYVLNMNNGTVTSVGTTDKSNIADLNTPAPAMMKQHSAVQPAESGEVQESTDEADTTVETTESITTTTVTEETTSTTETTTTTAETTTEKSPVLQFRPLMAHAEDTTTDENTTPESTTTVLTKIEISNLVLNSDDCKTSHKINDNYYYDSKSIMVMPLPETGKTPKFENKPGLLFTKVGSDTNGSPLKNADITINPDITGFSDGVNTNGSFLFDIDDLNVNQVYTLTETTAPDGYEIAKPVYLQKRDGNLYYGDTNPPTIMIEKNTSGYYSFTMEDIKISGAVPSLKKTDENGNVLEGATFKLYAQDGTFICDWENFDGKETSMKDKLLTVNNDYVKNGFLEPGVYYLEETVKPSRDDGESYKDPGKMYFTVKQSGNNFTIENGYLNASPLVVTNNGSANEVWVKTSDGSNISNITQIYFEATDSKKVQQIWELADSKSPGDIGESTSKLLTLNNATMSNANSGIKFANYNGSNVELTYVEIITADNRHYVYGESKLSQSSEPFVMPEKTSTDNTILGIIDDGENSANIKHVTANNIKLSENNVLNNIVAVYIKANTNIEQYHTNHSDSNTAYSGGNTIRRFYSEPKNVTKFEIHKWSGSDLSIESMIFVDKDGKYYTYGNPPEDEPKQEEDSTDFEPLKREVSPNLSVNGTDNLLLTVINKLVGNDTEVSVEKKWEDDDNAYNLQPTEINVQLYRTTTDLRDSENKIDVSSLTDADKVEGKTAILNASNQWKAKWTELPSKDASKNKYYYYVKESAVPDGYEVSYGGTESELEITNTLKKDTISITKKWEVASGVTSPDKPDTLNVTLKFKVKNELKTQNITLNKDENYTGSYDIPHGATDVSVEESTVPTGWKLKGINPEKIDTLTEGRTITITNVPDSGKLTVKKEWKNDKAEDRPNQIQIAVYRTTTKPGSGTTGGTGSGSGTGGNSGGNSESSNPIPEPNEGVTTLTPDSTGGTVSSFYCEAEGTTIKVSGIKNSTSSLVVSALTGSVDNSYTFTLKDGACYADITNGPTLGDIQIMSDDSNEVTVKYVEVTTTDGKVHSWGTSKRNAEKKFGSEHFDPDNNSLVPNYRDSFYSNQAFNNGKTVDQYNNYARLLQYSLYFYDANMCGNFTENAYNWRKSCHTDDEVTGGFHDAGDYVMFGLPQGFTASTLGWSYYEFGDSYNTLGLTSHIKDISQHFADFFYNAVKLDSSGNVTSVLYQKGNGNTDHSYNGLPQNQGSRKNNSEMYWTTNNTGGSEIAAEYAASLTLHYLNFGDEKYLDRAKKIYAYAKKLNKYSSGENQGFYPKNSGDDTTYKDDLAWAAAWLAVASKNTPDYDSYKKDVTSYLSGFGNGYLAHQWANVAPAAKVVASSYLDCNYWNDIKSIFDFNNNSSIKNELSIIDNGKYYCFNDWASTRYNLGFQLIAMAANNHNSSIDYNDWCKEQMKYILGGNKFNKCFVTGFAENSSKYPHYRATGNFGGEPNNKLVGALVGGPNKGGNYNDTTSDFTTNEVALDYNANLVMAAAGLYHFYKSGKTYANDGSSYTAPQALLNLPDVNTLDAEPQSDDTAVEEDVLDGFTLDNPAVDVMAAQYDSDNNPYYEYVFCSESDKNNGGNVNFEENVDIKNVKSIKVEGIDTDNLTWGVGITINGGERIYAGTSGASWTQNRIPYTIDYSSSPINVTHFKLDDVNYWSGTASGSPKVRITFYCGDSSGGETTDPDPVDPNLAGLVTTKVKFNGNKKDTVDVKKVKRIIIKFDNNVGNSGYDCNGMLKIIDKNNNEVQLPNVADNGQGTNNMWKIQQGTTYDYGTMDTTVDVTKYEFGIWGDPDSLATNNNNVEIIFYCEPEGFKITPDSTSIKEGEQVTITANKDVTEWVIPADLIKLSSDSRSCTVKAGTKTDSFIITAKNGTDPDAKATITVTGADFTIFPDQIKVRAGGAGQQITVTPNSDNISYISSDTSIATVSNSGLVTGVAVGETTIKVNRNGVEESVYVEVLGPLEIKGNDKMNKGKSQKLTVNNIGDVKWTVSWAPKDPTKTGAEYTPTISDDGILTAGNADGRVTIMATADGITTKEFYVDIELTAFIPNIPNIDETPYKIITLTSANFDKDNKNCWISDTINVEKKDPSGNPYYYYIVEVDSNGDPIKSSIDGKNSNIKYYPVEYSDNNGSEIDNSLTLSVTNEKEPETEKPDYTLPSAGGKGVTVYYITGAGIMLCAGVVIVRRRRRSA